MRLQWKNAVALSAVMIATGWASSASAGQLDCAELTTHEFGIDGLVIGSASAEPEGEGSPVPHCLVQGHIGERTGADGNTYRISFELRLPDEWNERFVHQFNGGNDGRVVPAMGSLLNADDSDNALSRNYAVVSSDAGHDGSAHPDAGFAGGTKFGFDPEARSDYGYSAVMKLNPVATQIVEDYYGKGIVYSYGVGTSNGGRHGLVQATRSPEAFDGILAGYPGLNLPKAAVQHAWDIQSFKAVSDDVTQAFSNDELKLVAEAVLEACDALDGLADGIVADSQACQQTFDISSLTCGETSNNCLTSTQVDALRRIHAGPVNSAGEELYSDWAWDRGIEGRGWTAWKLNSGSERMNNLPRIATLGASSLAMVFSNPPQDVGGDPDSLVSFLLDYDFDTDVTIDASTAEFPEAPMEFMTPTDVEDPEMADFREAGGKMIVFHGMSDPVFSALDTIEWYEKLDANNGGNAKDFVMFYTVPGMNHGFGGPATDKFAAFDALVDWVENGEQPDYLVATTTPDNPYLPELADATRKLCPYPAIARYQGGDEMDHDSFVCQ